MTSFTKIACWRPLIPNDEILDKTTYPYFENPRVSPIAENEAEFVMVKYIIQYASVSMYSHQLTKISGSLRVKYSNIIYQGY